MFILNIFSVFCSFFSIQGNIAYVAQQAWIQNATLEDNILFNNKKDEDRYSSCVRACALQSDLDMLPGGDQTEIGEKVFSAAYVNKA